MTAFVGALLVLTATSHGYFAVTVSACRPEANRIVQCYGALGGSIFLLGIDNDDTQIDVKKGMNEPILKFKKHTNRSDYFKNGTMRLLYRAFKNDSAEYNIDVFNAKGMFLWNSTIQLIIQAPLSEPVISHLCLPHGEVRVTCSSDGDVTEYNWTVGQKPLDGGVAYLKDEKDTVILKKTVDKDITCSVRNHVSHNYTTVQRFACQDLGDGEKRNQDTDTGVICVGFISLSIGICAVFMVFVLTAAMYCLNRKINRTGMTGEGENNTLEPVYTDVCHIRVNEGRGREKEQESTTIYGKITAPETLDQTQGRAHGQDDIVYARVHQTHQPITEQMP